jgi:hypothetical protein
VGKKKKLPSHSRSLLSKTLSHNAVVLSKPLFSTVKSMTQLVSDLTKNVKISKNCSKSLMNVVDQINCFQRSNSLLNIFSDNNG